jgi:hypothetical protein
MHQTSALHTVQPKLVLSSKANFLFYLKAFFRSFLKEKNKKDCSADNLVMDSEDCDALSEEASVSGPVYFRQYTLERKEGKLVYFGKWCHMTPIEESLASPSRDHADANSQSSQKTPSSIKFLNRKFMQRKLRLFGITLSVILLSFVTSSVFGQATVETDLPDYSPGQVVTVTGTNWYPGETVSINILSDCGCENFTYYVTAAADSTIFQRGFTLSIEHLGVGFTVTATGQTSLQVAQITFHDDVKIWENTITGNGINPNTSNPYTTDDVVYPNANITVSGIGKGVNITGDNANDRYSATSWNTSSLDADAYFNFILTPNNGYHIKFTDFRYIAQRSNTGPTTFAIRSSLDFTDIATNTLVTNNTPTSFMASLTGSQFQNITSSIQFRLYGWNATNVNGSFSVNSFTFNAATLGTSTTSLTGFSTCINTVSTAQSFTVNGVGLTPNSTITIVPSTSYELSTFSAVAGFQGAGSVTLNTDVLGAVSGTVWVRLKANATPGTYNETINVSGGGFGVGDNINASVSGTVNGPAITVQPTSSPIMYGQNTTFSITASGAATLTYQWQEKIGAAEFNDIADGGVYSNATTATLTLTKPGVNMSGRFYRCIVTNSCGSVPSDGTAALNITPKTLTVSAAANASKEYNGLTAATTTTDPTNTTANAKLSDNRVAGDAVTVNNTGAAFDEKNVSNTRIITVSGISITGLDAGNYTLAATTAVTSNNAVITPKTLTASSSIASKVYNGSPATGTVLLGMVTGLIGVETLNITPSASNYSNANVGNGKLSTITYLFANGSNGGLAINYVMSPLPSSGNITPAPLTASSSIASKVYNGSPATGAVTLGIVTGLVGTETLLITAAASDYVNANVGTAKPSTISYSLANGTNGGLAANYNMADVASSGDITQRPINITGTKVYNGTATFSGSILTAGNLVIGETVAFGGTATVSSPDVNSYNSFTTNGLTSSSANYKVTGGTVSVSITQQPVDISFEETEFINTANSTTSFVCVPISVKLDPSSVGDITSAIVKAEITPHTGATAGINCANTTTSGLMQTVTLTLSNGYWIGSFRADIGNTNSGTYEVDINVNGNYIGSLTDQLVTVSKPLGDFISGGGHITATSAMPSAGKYKADLGSVTNFGFNVKFNKSGTNLQGGMNIIVRSSGKVYHYKVNSMSYLGVTLNDANAMCANGTKGSSAIFQAKANLQDITNPSQPWSMGGNLSVEVRLKDKCEPGKNNDMISITIKNGTELLYSSYSSGGQTLDRTIDGGNLVAKSSASFGSTAVARLNTEAMSTQVQASAPTLNFDLKAYPNPTTSYFNVKLESSNITQPMTLNVVDVSGKVIETRKNLVAGQTFQLGANYRPGMYFVELIQGDTRRIVKLVKQPD